LKQEKERLYTVARLASDCGVLPSTVRYYVKEQLIEPKERTQTNYMIFDEASLEKLKLIKELREQNRMTIPEIKDYFKRTWGE
jgi:DNA-binding transcriptional MerR regulator